MNGVWSDIIAYPAGNNPHQSNLQGDGRFDQETIPLENDGSPGRPEMTIGRVDFRMLKDFVQFGEEITDTSDPTEIRLLKQYLQKVSQYRSGLMPAQEDVVAFIKNSDFMQLTPTVMRFSTRAGLGELTALERYYDDLFKTGSPSMFGVHGNYGNYDAFGENQDAEEHTLSRIASGEPGNIPRSMFSLFMGSYFGEWFNVNSACIGQDPLRAVIATPNYSLTSTWMDAVAVHSEGFDWRVDRFLMGFHYGTALQDSFSVYPDASCRHIAILGDPMLRIAPLPIVSNFSAVKVGAQSLGYDVQLSWNINPSATSGYRILRASSMDSSTWQFVADIAGNSAVHTASNPSTNIYLIKPLAIRTTGSGSYTNVGQGSFSATIVIP
jgi:hypothetical protein